MSSLPSILILTLFTQYAASLQVTPNSPCASLCIDSSGLDLSDPNSSTTNNSDISCYDSEYSSSSAGQKYQGCMSCLQDSTFAQGGESDQLWFLYNLRYTFDYCILGFPNATDVPSTPCSTSTACGGLDDAFTNDKLSPKTPGYSYCGADGSGMTNTIVSECMSCVGALDGQNYLANFLIALDAGCQQKPATGTLIGLNDTVFSETRISAVDPAVEKTTNDKGSSLTTTQLAGIAVGATVVVLAISGFLLVHFRKRKNRRLLLGNVRTSVVGQKKSRHRPDSSLSFRCQTHLTPRSPAFFPNPTNDTIEEEKPSAGPFSALGSHPVSPGSPRQSAWRGQNGGPGINSSSRPGNKALPLHNIATAIPAIPGNVHYSASPKAAFFSPTDEPASTTSTKSTAQLLPLRQYNPAEYGVSSPQVGSTSDGIFSSPTSGSTSSPLLSRAWEQRAPTWDLPPRSSSKPSGIGAWERVAAGVAAKNRRTSNSGSPVETKQINFNFPPPPARR
ncbi:uncharacterized protein GGS22DRAFT_165447 [Annulohypoxylon maeteangense]|uniref:uncharacterized protein n=1 Tax=Annulohypoxylon maeteangense TaxID=1927788 RepID=UPI002007F8BA|nr:uncharacterized protein GGS22DRAFT_165447 [Annulohypoxylon maeteangense]KAI0884350.1 hypothetical protein GGS22DRAFT_165447 [Annulohypoxylon maeteangense]